MKCLPFLVLAFLAGNLVAFGQFATTSDTRDLLSFSVIGYGKKFFTVDVADVKFSVSTRDSSAAAARDAHNRIVAALEQYLVAQNYTADIIKLESTGLTRKSRSSDRLDDDFYLSNSVFSIRSKRIADLSDLQADLVNLGVDEIISVDLFSSQQRALEDEAKELAIADARRKAAFTADQLDWALGKIISIEYLGQRSSSGGGFGARGSRHDGRGQASAASANFVDARVKLSFVYIVE